METGPGAMKNTTMKGMTMMMTAGVLGTLVSIALAAAPPGHKTFGQMTEEEITAFLKDSQRISNLGERMQAVSTRFLGTPYVLGNMGEGPDGDGRDTDPRFNVTSTDCTTFVEHVLAFATSDSVAQARTRLDAIRYMHGQVGYGTRRHWPEAQWVPGLVAEGFAQDATAEVAGPSIMLGRAEVELGVEQFMKSAHAQSMPLKPEEVPVGRFSVPFVPLNRVMETAPRMEPGMIINVVKEPRAGLLVRISHQGLVVRKGTQVVIRHASSVGAKAVVDEPLQDFVKRQKNSRSWPTVGFHFMRALAPAPGAASP